MPRPTEILDQSIKKVEENIETSNIQDKDVSEKVRYVARCPSNRAGVRLLLSCLLAKVAEPERDVRKPYTEIGTEDSFSGRGTDEKYLTPFINKHDLPCNSTTAFLTPALRNRNIILEKDTELVGRPKKLYKAVLFLLDKVHKGEIEAQDLLEDTIRKLVKFRNKRKNRLQRQLDELREIRDEETKLSTENILTIIHQHLECRNSSRLPVIVIAAAYKTAEENLKEEILPLQQHTAADDRTGALGDVEVTLENDNQIVTSYEMKMKSVTREDIDRALEKILNRGNMIDNYIFVTTENIDPEVKEYADQMYDETGGIEVAILTCTGFIRHFLHLFHRLRVSYLDTYEELLLKEPESAVRQELKEAFLSLRLAAESNNFGEQSSTEPPKPPRP